jgi:hypothetical protein
LIGFWVSQTFVLLRDRYPKIKNIIVLAPLIICAPIG